MEDEEYKKLPLEDRCVHKLWKARVNGYEEVTKLFRQIDDDKSPEFSKYLGLIKKFVIDSNAMGQEKGLEATLAFVENYAHAGKTVGEVMNGIVQKCIAAPKTRTRELALQVTLMYIEIEKYDTVEEELVKGMDQKNPKIVAACINACTTALHDFGSKVINLKPLVKKISALFGDRDKSVRDEARLMVVEMFKWIGPALRSQLTNLQPVQMTELEAEFAKVEGQKPAVSRFLRSQQQKQAKLAEQQVEADGDASGDECEDAATVDSYDLADPVDILSKLPKDFFEKLESKKWQERKTALETLETLLKTPKLESGDYGDVVRALKKVVQKDSNVLVVALAAKCIAGLASGLKKRFQTYATSVISALLEKFKEKKQNVLLALREAVDSVYATINIEVILEDVLEALANKNPAVKAETSTFLARAFTRTLPSTLNKKLLKALSVALIKNVNEPDPTVRDCAAEALGTLMKLVGEKAVGPFLIELEKDNLKMTKIKEFCDKAVIAVKVPGPKKDRPAPVPVKTAAAPKPVKRPIGNAAIKKRPTDISSGTATIVKAKGNKVVKPVKPKEREITDDEADEIVAEILTGGVVNGLSDANWKTRLASVEDFTNQIQALDRSTLPTQALVRVLNRKPGLKDTNFQVVKARLDAIKFLAEQGTFSKTTAECCLNDVVEKLGDVKSGAAASDALTAIAEATGLGFVSLQVIESASAHKSPKVLQEALGWLATAVQEFGFANVNGKALADGVKKALTSTNPGVRQSAVSVLGILYMYMGHALNALFENERSAVRDQINAEFDKYENESPPAPTRGLVKSTSGDTLDTEQPDEVASESTVDISGLITEALISELSDKNWKVRNEALVKVAGVLSDVKLIRPNIGDLPQALVPRLVDSNSKIAQAALGICETIANAMGPPCRQLVRTFLPGMLQGLGDSKTWIKTASLAAMNAFGEQCAYKEFFEAEMIGDALKTGSPTLRVELWGWLAEKLPKIKSVPKEELLVCVPHLYSNLEDRNADVRKNAQEAVLGIMMHLSYESMVKLTEKLKPGSKTVVMAALDKARPNLPVKPLPTKKKVAEKDEKPVARSKSATNVKNAVKKGGSAPPKMAATNRKKEDDVDLSPLLVVNNSKHQRTIDESKMKILKWNFTTPREEFVELLREQMSSANVNKNLISNMFHSDFRYHIKALESLTDDLPDNSAALISNLDLILKWLTLRFFDTNPSVLLKGLEYLSSVFNMLIENEYRMPENEAACFIPYLILKVGDPKDSVRNGVKSLFKQICDVYSMSKLFTYIMEGLKSKNARQRAECLDVMGSIIEDHGITVCLPSPAACLKEVAKQISDRDNSVRNAALNCVVQAYYIVGEKVFKMVGQISDKDMSLLEERIKRASKRPPKAQKTEPKPPSPRITSPVKNLNNDPDDADDADDDDDEEEEEEDPIPQVQVVLPSQLSHEKAHSEPVEGPFKMSPELLEFMNWNPPKVRKLILPEMDLEFLKEPITIPSIADTRAKMTPLSPPKPILPNETYQRRILTVPQPGQDLIFVKTINQMGSPDLTLALKAMEQMQEILNGNKSSLMVEYEDQFMTAVTIQLKLLHSQDPLVNKNVCRVYRSLLTVVNSFYSNQTLGRKLSVDVLKDVLNQLVLLLVEAKLEGIKEGEAYIRVVNLHCVKLIERSDHTSSLCALLKLLHDCVSTNGCPRLTELIMKCLWRAIKIMPSWEENIDYDTVLLEIHNFMRDYPSHWWKSRPSDTPMRTVKTVLHSITKAKGSGVMLHLGKIPNANDSEMESYILRLLKSMKLDEVKQVPLKSEAPRRSLTRSTHTQLTEIFQKIGNKEETKEGLTLLYDFLQQNPEADIDPFIKRSSQFFQDYIKDGLRKIEEARKMAAQEKTEESVLQTTTSSSDENVAIKGPEYWMDRLKMWERVWDDVVRGTDSTD